MERDIVDSGRINEAGLIAAPTIISAPADRLGHANLPTITHCIRQLIDIIQSRNLKTVTLNDVFT